MTKIFNFQNVNNLLLSIRKLGSSEYIFVSKMNKISKQIVTTSKYQWVNLTRNQVPFFFEKFCFCFFVRFF